MAPIATPPPSHGPPMAASRPPRPTMAHCRSPPAGLAIPAARHGCRALLPLLLLYRCAAARCPLVASKRRDAKREALKVDPGGFSRNDFEEIPKGCSVVIPATLDFSREVRRPARAARGDL